MNRFFAFFIIICTSVFVQAQTWPGTGNGTSLDPYLIRNANQLDSLRYYLGTGGTANNQNKYFQLANNIDLSEWLAANGATVGWNPIGTDANKFFGKLNGAGYIIKNLWINRTTTHIGLFGSTGAGCVISNLGIELADAGIKTSLRYVGTFAGRNNGNITNCYAKGRVEGGIASGESTVGGLVGVHDSGTISNCFFTGNIKGNALYTGGLVGYNKNKLTDSYFFGNVTGLASSGGLAGRNIGSSGVNLGNITNCYASGTVSGTNNVGGLVGDNITNPTLTNCAAINSSVSGTSNVGRVCGTSSTLGTNCYALEDMVVTGTTGTAFNGTTKSLSDLRKKDIYISLGWVFSSSAWDIWEANTYPFLAQQSAPTKVTELTLTTIGGYIRTGNDIAGNPIQVDSLLFLTQNNVLIGKLQNPATSWTATFTILPTATDTVYTTAYEKNKILSYPATIEKKYGEADKAALRIFLRQPAPLNATEVTNGLYTSWNGANLGLTPADTSNWTTSEIWIESVVGLTWQDDATTLTNKRLFIITWNDKNLAGNLNSSAFSELTELDCSNNVLSSSNTASSSLLTKLNYDNNRMMFSTLPLPNLQYTIYNYAPQETIDGGITLNGQLVNLTSEYLIAGTATDFTWYDITEGTEIPITPTVDNADGSFIFGTPFIGKKLRCKMTNSAFPDNVEKTIVYETIVNEYHFCGGNGTAADPYLVCTAAQLDSVRYFVGLPDINFRLENDIDLVDFITNNANSDITSKGWNPIGSFVSGSDDYSHSFKGIFDGNNHSITGLWIDRTTTDNIGTGLFGTTYGAILKYITIKTASGKSVSGYTRIGMLAGFIILGTISNCHSNGDVQGSDRIGGLIGFSSNGIVEDCSSAGTVIATTQAGGLVGYMTRFGETTASAETRRSYSSCYVEANNNLGGLVGNSIYGKISNCYATGDVKGFSTLISNSAGAGGLVGDFRGEVVIENCYASGAVSGAGNVGGLVGLSYRDKTIAKGEGSIINCVAANPSITTTVAAGSSRIGRIVGYDFYADYKNKYENNYALATMTVNGSTITDDPLNPEDTNNGKGQTEATLKQRATYETNLAWPFYDSVNDPTGVWGLLENVTYPFFYFGSFPERTTWKGSNSSNWNEAANWDNGIPGPYTQVIIPGGKSYYPILQVAGSGYTQAVCDSVTFEMGGEVAQQQQLIYNHAAVQLGMVPNLWVMLSPPLQDMYSGDYILSENRIDPRVYMQQYQTQNPQRTEIDVIAGSWSKPFNTLDVSLGAGMGYVIWIDDDVNPTDTFYFPNMADKYQYFEKGTGNPLNIWSGPLTRTNASRFIYDTNTTTFNLPVHGDAEEYTTAIVGNPFMSHLDFWELYQQNIDSIENKYYLWGGQVFDAVMVNVTSSSDLSDKYIAPMQSFIISKKDPSKKLIDLTVTPSMSVTNPGNTLRRSQAETEEILKLEVLRDYKLQSSIAIVHDLSATNNYQSEEDAWTLFSETVLAPAVLYALIEGKAASINTINDLNKEIPLGIRTTEKGSLTLQINASSTFPYEVYLEDRLLNKTVDLQKDAYAFANETGNVENRFFLHTSNQPTGLDHFTENIRVYTSGEMIRIASNLNDPIRSIEVVNLQGQIVLKKEKLNADHFEFNPGKANQILIVKVVTEQYQIVKKIYNMDI